MLLCSITKKSPSSFPKLEQEQKGHAVHFFIFPNQGRLKNCTTSCWKERQSLFLTSHHQWKFTTSNTSGQSLIDRNPKEGHFGKIGNLLRYQTHIQKASCKKSMIANFLGLFFVLFFAIGIRLHHKIRIICVQMGKYWIEVVNSSLNT